MIIKTRIKELLFLTLQGQTVGNRCSADLIRARALLFGSIWLHAIRKWYLNHQTIIFPFKYCLNSTWLLSETSRNPNNVGKNLFQWLELKSCSKARLRIWMELFSWKILHSILLLIPHVQASISFSVVNLPYRQKDLINSKKSWASCVS